MADLYDGHRIELFSNWDSTFRALQFNAPGNLTKEYDFFEMESEGGVSYGVSVRNYHDMDSSPKFIGVPNNGTFYESVSEFLDNEIESIRRISIPHLKADLVDRTTESSREGPRGPFSRCVIHELE